MSATPTPANQFSLTATVVTASSSSPAEQTLKFVECQPVEMPPYPALRSQVASDWGVPLTQAPNSADRAYSVFDINVLLLSFARTIASTSNSEAGSRTRMLRSGTRASTVPLSQPNPSTSEGKSPNESSGSPTTRSRTRESPTRSFGTSLPFVHEHKLLFIYIFDSNLCLISINLSQEHFGYSLNSVPFH